MLILSRKPNERIMIGNITITVQNIRGNRVAIGIEAPPEIKITRGELAGDTANGATTDQVIPSENSGT